MRPCKKIFPIDIYKRGVCVFFGTRDQFRSFIKKEGIDYDWDANDTDAFLGDNTSATTFRTPGDVLIFAEKKITEGTLCHELLHAARHILRLVDIDDEEALAYLLEYLYDKVMPWFRTTSFSLGVSP